MALMRVLERTTGFTLNPSKCDILLLGKHVDKELSNVWREWIDKVVELRGCVISDRVRYLGVDIRPGAAGDRWRDCALQDQDAADPELEQLGLPYLFYKHKNSLLSRFPLVYQVGDGVPLLFRVLDIPGELLASEFDRDGARHPPRSFS